MISAIVFILFSFSTLSSTHSENQNWPKGRNYSQFLNIHFPTENWFPQILDHFHPSNEHDTIWSQRYWVNSAFHVAGGPAFLIIGGEGSGNPEWISQGQWISYAQENNALCFLLEHRFYGESKPVPDLSIENLKYLNTQQALADLAYFINNMNEMYGPTINKWIVFGDSYAGSLSVWLRQIYPNLVFGAVSSSAPIIAKMDFYEYYQVVENSLALYNEECVEEVRKANIRLSELVKTGKGRSKISEIFKLRVVLKNDVDEIAYLFVRLANNFAEVVQYNKIKYNETNAEIIDDICNIMTSRQFSEEKALLRYAVVNEDLLSFKNTYWIDSDYMGYIENVKEINWKNADTERQWLYQTCTELGYFQTSSKPTDLFGPYFPVEFFTKRCEKIFGSNFNEQLLKDAIERTNTLFRALDTSAGNIIFVNGSVDPWHAVSLTHEDRDKPYEVIYIEGSAHSADIYPSSPEDSEQLIEARNRIRFFIKSWLSSDEIGAESSESRLNEDNCVVQ